jgi:antitoxin ParD1/3/4
MTITTIPDEFRSFVKAELERGRYESLDELLAEALRVLRDREEFIDERREEIRAQLAQGIAEAERGELLDGEEAMERIRRDLARRHGEE